MTEALKRQAADAALRLVSAMLRPEDVLGVGTGSTANHFIDGLAALRGKFAGAVSSSLATTERLVANGIPVMALNAAGRVAAYVDGADEVAPDRALVKGGGGALTLEKIVAASADTFVCVVDSSKLVRALGAFPLPLEVLPPARVLVEQRLRALGGDPRPRVGFTTESGNEILDVRGLPLHEPAVLATRLNGIPGVVENGLFGGDLRPDVVLAGTAGGIETIVAEDCPAPLRAALTRIV